MASSTTVAGLSCWSLDNVADVRREMGGLMGCGESVAQGARGMSHGPTVPCRM